MSANRPPEEFFGSDPATPPSPPRRSRAPLLIAFASAALVVLAGGGAGFWLLASSTEPKMHMQGGVPADGQRHYQIFWRVESTPSNATLRGVWASGQTVHAVGDGGVILTRDTTGAWSAQGSGTKATLHAVTSTSAGTMAVGDEGTVVVFDRASRRWNSEQAGTKASLRAVLRVGNEVFAAGEKGAIVRRNAQGEWTLESSPVEVDLHALSTATPNQQSDRDDDVGPLLTPNQQSDRDVYAVGANGTILYRAASVEEGGGSGVWVVQSAGVQSTLHDLAGHAKELAAVGQGGAILRLQTTADTPWAQASVPGAADLLAVGYVNVSFSLRSRNFSETGYAPCWMVGGTGGFVAIRPRDGIGPWHAIDPKPTQRDILAISNHHLIANDQQPYVFLVGEQGTIVSGRSKGL